MYNYNWFIILRYLKYIYELRYSLFLGSSWYYILYHIGIDISYLYTCLGNIYNIDVSSIWQYVFIYIVLSLIILFVFHYIKYSKNSVTTS